MASEPVNTIDQQFAELKTDFIQLKKEFANLQTAHTSLVRKVRASGAGVLIISCICLLSNSLPTALAQGYGTTLRSLLQRISALETAQKTSSADIASLISNVTVLNSKTRYLTTGLDRNGYPASYFTACNVYIQNGLGSTSGIPSDPFLLKGENPITNGLGNLIIGYNEPAPYDNPTGSHPINGQYNGSHNLIIGEGNQYNSICSMIGGTGDYSAAPFASVLNGSNNGALALNSTVCGGVANTVTNISGTVLAGAENVASGPFSSVSGGNQNNAFGGFSSVSGGVVDTAYGDYSSVSGGGSIKLFSLEGWAGGTYHSP